MRLIYIGGPSAIIEWEGLRLMTDPTFDPAGEAYVLGAYRLDKTQAPALSADAAGPIDAVLLSHDHHFDNLDRAGRAFLARVPHVLTTKAGADRLGGNAVGLEPWQSRTIGKTATADLQITATPARHGPAHMDRGPVVGFVLQKAGDPRAVYVSGDTVWYDGVRDVSERFDVRVAILNLGAAKVQAVGDFALTFTADEAVTVAQHMPNAAIVPLHFEGWRHFSESRADIERAFRGARLESRLVWPRAAEPVEIRTRP